MLIPFDRTPKLYPVSDIVFDDTVFKQQVQLKSIEITTDYSGGTMVVLTFLAYLFSSKAGGYGSRLPDSGPSSPFKQGRPIYLRADNSCAVYFNPADLTDPRNGEIIDEQRYKETDAWDAELEALPIPVIKQGDLFALLQNYPQVINDMVTAEIGRADAYPHYKFALHVPAA